MPRSSYQVSNSLTKVRKDQTAVGGLAGAGPGCRVLTRPHLPPPNTHSHVSLPIAPESRQEAGLGTAPRYRFARGPRRPCSPTPGGAGPGIGERLRLGRVGPGAVGLARGRVVSTSALRSSGGSPGWVVSGPSAFREGDSAMLSRVEKLCETRNPSGERGGASSPSSSAAIGIHRGLILNLQAPHPPPRNPAPGAKRRAAAAVPRSRDAGTPAPAGGGGSLREPGLDPSALLSPSSLACLLLQPGRSKSGLWAPGGRGTRRDAPGDLGSWRGAASLFSPRALPSVLRSRCLNLGVWWDSDPGSEDVAVHEPSEKAPPAAGSLRLPSWSPRGRAAAWGRG